MRNVLIDLYVATFGRAPDPEGLYCWKDQYDLLNLAGVASNMMLSPEAQTRFPGGLDNAQLVTLVYENLFDRAPDAQGLEYWLDQVYAGVMSREMTVAYIVEGARASTGDPQDALILNERVLAAREYLEQVEAGVRGFDLSEAEAVVAAVSREDDPDNLTFSIISESPDLNSSGYATSYQTIKEVLTLPEARIVLLEPGIPEYAFVHVEPGDTFEFDYDTFIISLEEDSEYRLKITPDDPSVFQSNKIVWLYDTSGDRQDLIMNTTDGFVGGSLYSSFFTAQESGDHYLSVAMRFRGDFGHEAEAPELYTIEVMEAVEFFIG